MLYIIIQSQSYNKRDRRLLMKIPGTLLVPSTTQCVSSTSRICPYTTSTLSPDACTISPIALRFTPARLATVVPVINTTMDVKMASPRIVPTTTATSSCFYPLLSHVSVLSCYCYYCYWGSCIPSVSVQ